MTINNQDGSDITGQDMATHAIMDTLQKAISDGHIGSGGMVSSFLTIVESIDGAGNARVQVLFNDNRSTTLFGLLRAADVMLVNQSALTGPPPA